MASRDYEEQMIKRLDVLVALALEPKVKDLSVKEKVGLLYNLGLNYTQIAAILNKTSNNIAVMINSIKKKK